MKKKSVLILIFLWISLLVPNIGLAQRTERLPSSTRHLEIDSPRGKVELLRNGQSKPIKAEEGDTLTFRDSLTTKGRGAAVILVASDKSVTIRVSENTSLQIEQINEKNRVRYMRLKLNKGKVFVTIPKQNMFESRLSVETPSTILSPRNTEFGVTVDPSGKTGLATQKGKVIASALDREVAVESGFQNLTVLNEPPSAATPLNRDTRLLISDHSISTDEKNSQQLQIKGKVLNPVNLLIISDELQETKPDGQFDVAVDLVSPKQEISAVIIPPIGDRQRPRKIWSQACEYLKAEKTGEVEIKKDVSLPGAVVVKSNWDTDFVIPDGKKYDRFWVEIVSEDLNLNYMDAYLKYKNETPQRFYAKRDPDKANTTYTLAVPRRNDKPYQVNVRIGHAAIFGKPYRVSVSACNDKLE
jgi:FecR protein